MKKESKEGSKFYHYAPFIGLELSFFLLQSSGLDVLVNL